MISIIVTLTLVTLTTFHLPVFAHSDIPVEEKFGSVKKDMRDLQQFFDGKLKDIHNKLRQKEASTTCLTQETPVVLFLAHIVQPDRFTLGEGEMVIFENVTDNIGLGYDKYSGVFTAPVKGVYHFASTARVGSTGHMYLGIYKNDQELTSSVGRQHCSLSVQATTTLDETDRVFIKNASDNKEDVFGDGFSFFSGYLLEKVL